MVESSPVRELAVWAGLAPRSGLRRTPAICMPVQGIHLARECGVSYFSAIPRRGRRACQMTPTQPHYYTSTSSHHQRRHETNSEVTSPSPAPPVIMTAATSPPAIPSQPLRENLFRTDALLEALIPAYEDDSSRVILLSL